MMNRPLKTWSFNYEDLAKLTGMEMNSIHQAACRGRTKKASGFNPDEFKSVVLWVFRNATDEFREDLMGQMGFWRKQRF